MNSIVSIHRTTGGIMNSVIINALNGGATLEPYTGTFTWNSTTYTKMYVFTATSGTNNINISENKTCGLLLLGGGGGGGSTSAGQYEGAGGAGAGGLTRGTLQLTGNATYTITIGDKGNAGPISTTNTATNGGNSSITGSGVSEIAFGGARGGQTLSSGDITSRTAPQSGGTGGNGGGSMRAFNVGTAGLTNTSQANCSTTTNTKSLTWVGYGGIQGVSSSYGGGGGGAAGNASNSIGGGGYRFNVGGATPFSDIYVCAGGCGGGGSSTNQNQSSITTVGGVVGGSTTKPTPDNAITYGSGGSGALGTNTTGYSGANGKQGLCIILVP